MQPTQPGMPNMKFIMYFLPFTLMIFFNNFASGLSLYYTISNLLTIVIIYAIKNFIIDEMARQHKELIADNQSLFLEVQHQRQVMESLVHSYNLDQLNEN